ncbi:RNA-directed DNA polymerase-like protein [Plakobranchus ocellatus]|uniref:RNA-directed DNA polymerase-like protein n=1 Tax=Plakobranchus ocellatus TaxID=259542 RepID=A0AAV4AQG1_9GAST|nr:RNA-directed DNA polymerase-like protein [Plakobranchus ocellatus]
MTEDYCKQLPQHPQQVNKIHHRSTPRSALTKHRQGAQKNYHHTPAKPSRFSNKGKTIRNIQESSELNHDAESTDEDPEYIFHIIPVSEKLPRLMVMINGKEIKVLADSGSSTNIFSLANFQKIQPPPQLKNTECKILSYASSKPLEMLGCLGCFDAVIQAPNGSSCNSKINVIRGNTTPLLGWPTCQQFEILKTSEPVNHLITNPEQIFTHYPEVF